MRAFPKWPHALKVLSAGAVIAVTVAYIVYTAVVSSTNRGTTLFVAYAQNSQPVIDALQLLGERIEKKTDGAVTVRFFPDSQLGGERELVELLQVGAIDITKVSAGLMESFSPIYGVFSMPFLFDDTEHFYRVMDSPKIMAPIYESTQQNGFVGMGYYDSGSRSVYVKDRPVRSVEDLAGRKLRVMQSEAAIEMMRLLGATPVAMGQAEVYTAMQQGILDGAENNEFALTIARHAEIAKHYTYTMHTRIPDVVLISNKTLEKLTDDQVAAVYEAMEESIEFQKRAWGESIEATRKMAVDEFGVTFYKVDRKPFVEAVQPIYEGLKPYPKQHQLYLDVRAMGD
ncbi:TRAP transporter substrate-binding protein [Gilvimarinus sp. SDUM040013]|uniref:TRAP transporter substrate-binding protein n=1 Tax=Gilvimarinus gilvus TaxID=3058038 RepID=A0ABU4RX24_9GAMM|nr:TRAP transporter substrate-binding protein [Gilvimarinus sp. SDUM040013]MDO3386668.1 TRAP transporter substrate-binding protein [Gilvimarinus sp. SDUM040013]MDX6849445.1 TRAP transporter substrate-binding protein [Gilvimarinus sp. SDUM040013]